MKPKKKMAKKIRKLKIGLDSAEQLLEIQAINFQKAQKSKDALVVTLSRKLNDVSARLLELSEIENLYNSRKEQLAKKDDVINTQQARRMELIKDIKSLKQQRDTVEIENRNFQDAIRAAAKENADLRSRVDKLKEENVCLIKTQQDYENKLREIQPKKKPAPKIKQKAKTRAKAPAKRRATKKDSI